MIDAIVRFAESTGIAMFDWRNLIIWVIGFVVYRLLMRVDIPVGNTLPDMLITMALCVVSGLVIGKKSEEKAD